MVIRSRRDFLRDTVRSATALGAMSTLSRFGQMNALASAPQSGYQALVCIFMSGGNDGHNTVIPLSTVQQGYIEKSNVNSVGEMSHMVEVMRSYTAVANLLQQQSDLHKSAIEKLADVPA